MEGTPGGEEIRLMEEGTILEKLKGVRLQSTHAATNAVDMATLRME